MALQEAKRQVTHAKVGAFGPAGSGKTTILSELAIAVSKQLHSSAPVAFFATEPGVDYVIPMFETEGIKLYVERSKAFKDLLTTVTEAQKLGCCALVVDSITHVWVELVDAFCRARNITKPEFQHWRVIKGDWAKWANTYVNAPLHIFVAGRAGFEYGYETDDETGKKELVKGDSKMKAEGDFGYEADLLMELGAHSDKTEQRKARGKKAASPRMVHTALIRKSRVWELNGKEFSWPDQDHYQAGDFAKVSDCFKPFIGFLSREAASGPVVDSSRTSEGMFDRNGDSEYHRNRQQKTVAIEDWDATMAVIFPGQDAASKGMRAKVGEALTGVRSKTAFEALPLDVLQRCALTLRCFEKRMKIDSPSTPEDVLGLVEMAKEDVMFDPAVKLSDSDAALMITNQDAAF